MNNVKLVVFDLDGTLTDSSNSIYEATIEAFNKLHIVHSLKKPELDKKIGAHFEDIFNDFNITVPNFDEFITIYKEYYYTCLDKTIPYPGVFEVLSALKDSPYKTALLTTKGQEQADIIAKHFEFDQYLDFVMGRRDGIANKPSAEPLLFICNEFSIPPEETIMVGDSEFDIGCGKNAGALTCAASYGYRPIKQLIELKPDFIIDSIRQLISHLELE